MCSNTSVVEADSVAKMILRKKDSLKLFAMRRGSSGFRKCKKKDLWRNSNASDIETLIHPRGGSSCTQGLKWKKVTRRH